jgi:hypothetical protein
MIISLERDFGVEFDGVTDNADALRAVRHAMLKKKEHHIIYLSSGTMLSSENRWLFGIESFTLIGHNTVLRSITESKDEIFQRPIWVGELLQNNVLEYKGTKEYEIATKVVSTHAGEDHLIPLSKFKCSPGDQLLLYAGNHDDNGYPPPADAEWLEVEKADGEVLWLNYPLQESFSSSVWDNPVISGGGCGQPRIVNLSRSQNTICKFAKFVNIVFGSAVRSNGEPVYKADSGNFVFPAMRLDMIRCKVEGYLWPSEAKTIYYEDVEANRTEFDKLVDMVICERVKFKGSPNGGGSIRKIIINNSYAGSGMRFDSRYLEVTNTHLRSNQDADANVDQYVGSLSTYPAKNPMRQVLIENLTFSSGISQASSHIDQFALSKLIVDNVSDKRILISDFHIVKSMEEGTTVLFKEDGSNGGLITDISYREVDKMFVIEGDWNRVPSKGETWMWSYVKNVIDLGGHRILDGKRLYNENSIRWKGNKSSTNIKEMHLTQDDFKWPGNLTIDLYGFIDDIDFHLKSPYKENGYMNVESVSPYKEIFNVQLATGTQRGTMGKDDWCGQLTLNTFSLTGGTSKDQLPKFDLIIKWRPY